MEYIDKCNKLKGIMDEYTKEDVMIAFSGGVDSSLLLSLAVEMAKPHRKKVYAINLHTMLHPMGEETIAKKIAEDMGAIYETIKVDELEEAGIINNPVDRCYLCKKCLFNKIIDRGRSLGVYIYIEGTNEDDLHVYRPGIKAVKELGIHSPLAEAKMSKKEIRRLAKERGLEVSSKPSTPCLATRFPYGDELDYDKLRKVEQGEAYIKTLGIYNARLRVHKDIARIEVDEKDLFLILDSKDEIITYLKGLGYRYITLDLEGFRSGSMDENISKEK